MPCALSPDEVDVFIVMINVVGGKDSESRWTRARKYMLTDLIKWIVAWHCKYKQRATTTYLPT